ncbi:MAG: RES family NAD+ phosphorylase [Cecembia sp.]
MKVFRIALTQYCDASGEGAKRFGGRWNLPGNPALYAGASVASSLLERLTIDPELFASNRYVKYSVMEIKLPADHIFTPSLEDLPKGWDLIPAIQASMKYGTGLLQSGILAFAVPSVVDSSSLNYVINPLSPQFSLIEFKVYPLALDSRIIR